MSSLCRMSVQGIRSFGPDETDVQMLTFFNPLTLIVGQNGAGKTTIIECLKYVATGDMPPGSKGGAFVHDPKVARESEVKGQIRLELIDTAGQKLVVIRSIVATQRGAKIECKSVESNITTIQKGKKVSISSKCIDFEKEMVLRLGVSKAILNNVIFCHQEDSNWPLSEGKALKTKFDDIFATTSYIKALENIKKIRTDQNGNVKTMSSEIKYLKQNKEKSAEISSQLKSTQARATASRETIEKVLLQMKPIEEKLNQIQKISGEIFELEKKIEHSKAGRNQIEKSCNELEMVLGDKLFIGSDKDLQEALNNEDHLTGERQRMFNQLKKKRDSVDVELEQLSTELTQLVVKQSALQQEIKNHNDIVTECHNEMRSLASDLNLVGFGSQVSFSGFETEQFMKSFKSFVGERNVEMKNIKVRYEDNINNIQRDIDVIRDNKSKLQQRQSMNTDIINKNKAELSQIKRDLSRVDSSAARLEETNRNLLIAESDLEAAEKTNTSTELKQEISYLQKNKETLLPVQSRISQEMYRASCTAGTKAKYDMMNKDLNSKQDTIRKSRARVEDEVKYILGGSFPETNVKTEVTSYLTSKSDELSKSNRLLEQSKMELSRKEATKKLLQEQLQKKETELRTYESKLFEVSSSQDFDREMESLQSNIASYQDEKGALRGSDYMMKAYCSQLDKPNSACPLCHRQFDTPEEIVELIDDLKRKLRMVPQNLDRKEKQIQESQKRFTDMINVKPLKENVTTLSDTDIPELKTKLQSLNSETEKLKEFINESDDHIIVISSDKLIAEAVLPDLQNMDRIQTDVNKLRNEMKSITEDLPMSASERSVEEIEKEKRNVDKELKTVSESLDLKRQQLSDQTERLQKLKGKVNEIHSEKLKLTSMLQSRQQLIDQSGDLNRSNSELSQEIREAMEKSAPLDKQLKDLMKDKQNLVSENESALDKMRSRINQLQSKDKELTERLSKIEKFTLRQVDGKLESMETRTSDYHRRISAITEQKGPIESELEDVQRALANQEVNKRSLSDNMKLRHKRQELNELNKQVSDVEKQLGGYDHSSLKRESKQLQKKQEDLMKERHQVEGRLRGLEDEIRRFDKELNSDLYKDAHKKYMNKFVELKTTQLVCSDLETYYKVLDRAIMKFHETKMKEINLIIRELWRSTYTSSDIEKIEIRFTEDDAGISKVRRNYNYKVVMVKRGATLDMRGRCSMGQKVLASLIIRLALAETFSLNCGILALDEPTTNLDRENIESLAHALIEIVTNRQANRKFQLVIITHDEDFVEILSRSDCVDRFYRVKKTVMGLSTIQKCDASKS